MEKIVNAVNELDKVLTDLKGLTVGDTAKLLRAFQNLVNEVQQKLGRDKEAQAAKVAEPKPAAKTPGLNFEGK